MVVQVGRRGTRLEDFAPRSFRTAESVHSQPPEFLALNPSGLTPVMVEEEGGRKLGGKAHAGWAYDYGKGRVVFTAVGHTVHAMWNPQYFELQKRSIRWLLKQI